jgi:glycerophosphoryl diester phosphodiesterase
VDAVELDVLITADGEIIVHHDFYIKAEIARIQDGSWLEVRNRPAINDLTLDELKAYDVGRLKPHTSYAARYPEQRPADGAHIPTLREVVLYLKKNRGRKTQLWIEIKTSPEKPALTPSPESVVDALVQVIREERVSERSLILSFDWRSLVYTQKIAPEIPTAYLSPSGLSSDNIKQGQSDPSLWTAGIDVIDYNGSIPRAVRAAGGHHWAPNYNTITPDLVREAHALGLQVFVWTPDTQEQMIRLMKMNVDGIITNRPDILVSLIEDRQGNEL